ncbi:uncharacterized protein [Primulina eburnea]|uniref:uncharacterized protein n=1 Tax=Primulina eburnea TaxID=1245227 RepID=UPI003C6C7FBA
MAASLSEVSTREVLHVSRLILSTDEEGTPDPESSWMTPLIRFIENGALPEDRGQAQKIKRQAPRFVLLNAILYKRSFQGPLLKCLPEKEDFGGLGQDAARVVQTCEGCQHHTNFKHSPATLMKPIWASCPFDQWGMDIVGPFPIARAQKKFLLVAVDYFSKWVEAEPLARITETEALKTRLQGKGKDWVEELPSVLWAYRTTPRIPTQETPFSLVYGSEAVLPVEIGKTSPRVESDPRNNDESRARELDLVEEKRDRAFIRKEAYRGRVMRAYNKRVRVRDFQIGDLVMKKVNPAGEVGKLEAKWEGSYKIIRRVSPGSFYLEDAQGRSLKRPWNAFNLKQYYT